MKVILNEDVPGLGEPGKIVDVAPGYARNFLVPRGLAIYADRASVKELDHHKKRLERKHAKMEEAAKSVAERINGTEIEIEARSGEGGKLYGSVTTSDIAKILNGMFDTTVDRRKISLSEPIRSLGVFKAVVALIGSTNAEITVKVFDNNAEVVAPKAKEETEVIEEVIVVEEVVELPATEAEEIVEEIVEEIIEEAAEAAE